MELFLRILLYIGISLGALLGVLIVLALLVLFYPIRYKAKAIYKEDEVQEAYFKANWLFHIVSFSFDYKSGKTFKIFGIKLKQKNDEERLEKSRDDKKSGKKALKKTIKESDEETDSDIVSLDEGSDNADTNSEENLDLSDIEETDKKSSKKESESLDSSKNKIYDKIIKYLNILGSDLFKRTYRKCKDKMIKLLKIILPRKWDVNAVIGFDDPATTGSIIGYTSMFYPLIAKHIHIRGDFNRKVIDVNAYAKGHFTIFKVGYILLNVYFDKNIRKLKKMFKEI